MVHVSIMNFTNIKGKLKCNHKAKIYQDKTEITFVDL